MTIMKTLVYSTVGLAFAAATAITLNDAKADHPPGQGGKITAHLWGNFAGFDSGKIPVGNVVRIQVLSAIHDNLFDIDPKTNKFIPQAGLSATPSDDFKRWRIELRPGMKFSNNIEVTAKDYKAHIDRLTGGKFRARMLSFMGPRLDRVEAPGKYTIDFIFKEASPGFQTILAQPIITWYVQEAGFVKDNLGKKEFNQMDVGQGAYMVKEWKVGSHVKLVRNPHYWNTKAQHLDEINYLIVKSMTSAVNALRAGQIDIMPGSSSIWQFVTKDPGTTLLEGVSNIAPRGMGFNNSVEPLNDIRVRRALVHAIDRQKLGVMGSPGGVEIPNHMYPKPHPWYCKDTKFNWPEFSPEKARALVKDYGKPIKFTINVHPAPTNVRTGEAMQVMWKRVGIDVTIKVGVRGPARNRNIRGGKFKFWWTNLGSNVDPSVVALYFHSKDRANYYKVKDAAVDAAIARVKKAKSRQERFAASCDYQKLLVDQLRYIPIRTALFATAHRNHLGGVIRPNSNQLKAHRVWIKK